MMIQDNNIPMDKVEELLKSGISIGEYLKKPWESFEMTEPKWISKRRAGMTSEEIEIEATSSKSINTSEIKNGFMAEMQGMSGSGKAISSLFLPGFQQLKMKRKAPGIVMVSLAATSVGLCTGLSISKKSFFAVPLFCILIPDMVWSCIDYKISSDRKQKQ